MDSLAKKHNKRDIRSALNVLPEQLDNTYEEALKRIYSQENGDVDLAVQVLSWICFALRPLSVLEIQHALAVETGDTELCEDAIIDEEILVSVCEGLVTIDRKEG
jgi:hypothetical protein